MKPMNESIFWNKKKDEEKLFGLVSQLINALSYKQSIGNVKEMMKNNIKVTKKFTI